MSSVIVSALSTVIRKRAAEKLVHVTTKRGTLFRLMMERYRAEPSAPDGPSWQASFTDHSAAATFAETGPYPAPSRFDPTALELNWARYAASVRVSKQALLELANAGNEARIANYIDEQMERAMRDMIDEIESDLVSNDPTTGDANGIAGFAAIMSTTNVYAGTNRATQTLWQPVNDATGGAPTKAIMDAVHDGITDTREGDYDLIIGSLARCRDVAELTPTGSTTFQQTVDASGGLTSILGFLGRDKLKPVALYNDRPVVPIPNYTNSVLHFINTADLRFEVLADMDFGDLMPVQDSPMFTAVADFYCQLRYDDTYSNAGFASGLT